MKSHFKHAIIALTLLLCLFLPLMLFISPVAAAPARAPAFQEMAPVLSPEVIAGVAGFLLSFLFFYIPKLNERFAQLPESTKQLAMLFLMLIVALGAYGLACVGLLYDLFGINLACNRAGAIEVAKAFIWALAANQAGYLSIPKPAVVKQVSKVRAGKAETALGRG